jgi:hypothetical protein
VDYHFCLTHSALKQEKTLIQVMSSFNTVTMQRKSCDQNAGKEPLVTMSVTLSFSYVDRPRDCQVAAESNSKEKSSEQQQERAI